MISPWTIYKERKNESLSEDKIIKQEKYNKQKKNIQNTTHQNQPVATNQQLHANYDQLVQKQINQNQQNITKAQKFSSFMQFDKKPYSGNQKPFSKQKKIFEEQNQILKSLNSLLLMKVIKVHLKKQSQLENQFDQSVRKVIDRLNPEAIPKVSPQEQLLDKILKNQKDKMQKHSKKVQEQKGSKQAPKQISFAKNNNNQKHEIRTRQDLIKLLKYDIEQSSIIKFAKKKQSPYLENVQTNQQSNKREKNMHVPVNNNNVQNTEQTKIIYIGQKFQDERLSSLQHQVTNQQIQQSNNQIQPYFGGNNDDVQTEKSLLNGKKNRNNIIHHLIKEHMELKKQRRLNRKSQQISKVEKMTIESIKAHRAKQYSSINLNEQDQKGIVNSSIKNTRKGKSVSQGHDQKQASYNIKSSRFLDRSSPLLPPAYVLPSISSRSSQIETKSSPSSQLLQLITNEIIQKHKSDSHKKANSIDKQFSKGQYRNQNKILKNISQIDYQDDRDLNNQQNDQINFNSIAQRSSIEDNIKQRTNSDNILVLKRNQPSQALIEAFQKDFFSLDNYGINFNKMKHKFTPLQDALTANLSSENHQAVDQTHKTLEQNSSQSHQMNKSHIKFSDHKIYSPIKQKSINKNKIS